MINAPYRFRILIFRNKKFKIQNILNLYTKVIIFLPPLLQKTGLSKIASKCDVHYKKDSMDFDPIPLSEH